MPSARSKAGAEAKASAPAISRVKEPVSPTHPVDLAGKRTWLVGFTASRSEAPYDDPDQIIVGCNNGYKFVPRCDVVFDLHDRKTIAEDPEHEQWLREGHCPVVMWRHDPEFPTSVPYPIDAVKAEFGDYWTNSISLMVAWALVGGASFLGVVGVDMAQGGGGKSGEYAAQRPSCEWMIGHAQARLGRDNVYIPETSDLLKTAGIYGLDNLGPFTKKLNARESELVERLQGLEQQHGHLMNQAGEIEAGIHQLRGALEDVRYLKGVWLMPEVKREGRDPLAAEST